MKLIFVEGESDKHIIEKIVRKLNIPSRVISFGGVDRLLSKYKRFAKLYRYEKLIILVDEDARPKIFDLGVLALAKRELEAWLLANYDEYENPETVPDPKKELRDFLSKKREVYISKIPYCTISLNLERMKGKCESFRDFLEKLLN